MFNKQAFNRNQFETAFAKALETLHSAEKITRKELRDLSRSVLEALHCTEDVAFINRLLSSLTPINRRSCIEYFKEFSGFYFDDVTDMFTKKNKQTYLRKSEAAFEFLAEPHNNLWTWAEINLIVEKEEKPYDIDAVTKYVEKQLKKAKENGLSEQDVIRAVFKGGLQIETIIEMMDEFGYDVA